MGNVIETLRARTEAAERRAERLRRMLEFADQLGEEGLAEFVALIGENGNGAANGNGHTATTGEETERPRGREAIRRIVSERPGVWTLADLRAELKARGWLTSPKAVEVAASRLCDINGEGKRIGKGRYVFPANHGEEGAIESDASGGALIPFQM